MHRFFRIFYYMINKRFDIVLKIFLLDFFDLVSFLVFVTWMVLFIRFFLFNPYSVVGASMEPTFHQGDFIIVDKITPKFETFKRWDIIVFVPKWKNVPYIKRIIGLPWETVKIQDNQILICNNKGELCEKLPESYIPDDYYTQAKCWKNNFVMSSSGYFAMWDHRGHSTDSSCCFGAICNSWSNYQVYPNDIIGKVAIRIFPNFSSHW